ncbi:hypothetical protein J2I47_21415 [Fibrella sp. HMF5335]|uniref:Uncharacterized protein n=1 Tax=Fibrella rubiginis TaxID=2817060 RepID=A0A939K6R4_9BACT|nr:hypothetical protein [Fibrella rubiginis]MBO0939128.1 hypothetical protein [Fibrella rubiginis]
MKTVDSEKIASCVQECFMLSLDDRLTIDEQKQMNVLGKRLRGHLINLLSATFDDGVKEVEAANKQLQAVNQQLSDTNEVINKVAATVKTVTKLVQTLDNLLTMVARFV